MIRTAIVPMAVVSASRAHANGASLFATPVSETLTEQPSGRWRYERFAN